MFGSVVASPPDLAANKRRDTGEETELNQNCEHIIESVHATLVRYAINATNSGQGPEKDAPISVIGAPKEVFVLNAGP
jgi:hypothetical protein